MVKAIIFDLGNVIVNFDETPIFEKWAASGNKTADYIKKYYKEYSAIKSFERGEISSKLFYTKTKNDLDLKMNFSEFKKVWCNIFTLNKDVAKLIKKLKNNYRLVLLSNTDILHYGYIKNKYKIIDIFDEFVLSYKVGYRKPNPLIFLNALRKAKTLPFNCVYIDDIPEFVYVARLMGIRAFQYKSIEKLNRDLKKVL